MTKPLGCPKVTVIVCTLNEEANLKYVLPRIPDWIDEILIVDGHSTDNTVKVARDICPRAKIILQTGKGKGNALKDGVNDSSGEIIITLDADGENSAEDISLFIQPLLNGYDFAKGSRLSKGKPATMPWRRWLGNLIIVNVCNVLYKVEFSDLCSGYNAFWRKKALDANLWENDNWGFEPSLIAKALKNGLRIFEVPHDYTLRMNGCSKLPNWKQGLTSITVLVKERFHG